MTLNRIHVIGNVGNDPEMRYTPNGNPTITTLTNEELNAKFGK